MSLIIKITKGKEGATVKADAVFEGGGVKGIAFIGALKVMEEHGYVWEKLAGTSAGAIVAALLSAGYKSVELLSIFRQLDYSLFLQRKGIGRLPGVGPVLGLLVHEGMYVTERLERFIGELLEQKGVRTFGDLPPDKLRVIASDITAGKMLILPDDLGSFGIDPRQFSVAKAVRMSASIPFYFQPAVLKKGNDPHYIVDGGLLSNYPVWLFDVQGLPRWPTIGFRLHAKRVKMEETRTKGLFSFTRALILTMLDAHDRFYVQKSQAVRTVFIDTEGVRSTQFHLSGEMRKKLLQSGEQAAHRFLEHWSFAEYVRAYRGKSVT
jgi:NTE family protein